MRVHQISQPSRRRIAVVLACVLIVITSLTDSAQRGRAASVTDGLTPGVPAIAMPFENSPSVWNEVDDATGRVTAGIICAEGCPARSGYTYIWNPIGASSGGQYYTNGLYVAQGGQYVLPGSKVVRAPDGTPLTPDPIQPPSVPPTSGGISGLDVLVINSNGARCVLTARGWWYGTSPCIGRDIQFTVCFVSSDSYIHFDSASWGFTLKSADGQALMADTYPPRGVTINAGGSCASGNIQSWHYQQLAADTSYTIDAWGSNAGRNFTTSFAFSTSTPNASPPIGETAPPSSDGSASMSTLSARKYTNCPSMRKDFSRGVSRAANLLDKVKPGVSVKSRASVKPEVYTKNVKLDTDKDGIACE